MVKVSSLGQMVKFMMANGSKELKTDLASGREPMATHISESGALAKSMGMAFINGKMEIATKVNGKTVSSTVKAQISLLMVTHILAIMHMENLMVLETTSGKMEHLMLEISQMGLKMGLENGKKTQDRIVTSTMVTFSMI
jgi:hypothetical protein